MFPQSREVLLDSVYCDILTLTHDGRQILLDSNDKKHICDHDCLTKNIESQTMDLTILPLNLVLALFLSENYQTNVPMNQKTSQSSLDVQTYYFLKGIRDFLKCRASLILKE